MQKTLTRFFCLALSALLGLSLLAGVLPTSAKAATSYDLATLLGDGKTGLIKPLGRTKRSVKNDGSITADWSGNGFEVTLEGASYITVGYDTNISAKSTIYAAVHVDGQQINTAGELAGSGIVDVNNVRNANIKCEQGTGTFTVKLPDTGKHTISVFRETGHTTKSGDYFRFTTFETDTTNLSRPEDKKLYIEVIGDSIATGSGSIAEFEAGHLWSSEDHSAQSSFGWQLSKMLDADISIASRGGSGLLTPADKAEFKDDGSGAGETIDAKATSSMLDIWPNASGHNAAEGDFESTRTPDLVVIDLGANDSLDYDMPAKTARWKTRLGEMIELVREKHKDQNLKILLYYHSGIPYSQMLDVAKEYDNVYTCFYHFHPNGSIAKESQLGGHPDASDQRLIAEALYNYIQEQEILSSPVATEPTYNDEEYYVSAIGNDSNDGKSISTAKKTFTGAVAQAVKDKDTLEDNSRVVIYLDSANGEVANTTSTKQHFGGDKVVTSSSGKKLPVLVTTYNYGADGVAKAVLDTSHTAKNDTHGSMVCYNDFTFRSITIQGTTRSSSDTATKFYRDRNLYAGYNEVVFDDVTFSHKDGELKCSNPGGWRVSPGIFGSFDLPETDTVASITFLNGDYSDSEALDAVYGIGIDKATKDGVARTEAPHAIHKVIIGDGAEMGTVVGLNGTFAPQSVTVEFRGGTVVNYIPTLSGEEGSPKTYNTNLTTIFNGGSIQNTKYFGTGDYITFNGNVTNEFRKGQFSGQVFAGLGSNVTLNGNLTNNISSGEIRVEPQTSDNADGIFLAGYTAVTINGNATNNAKVTNNISSGDLNLLFRTEGAKSGIYLGARSGNINGDLTNNVSGGNLFAASYVAGLANKGSITAGIYMGMYSGNINGTLASNITAGTFDGEAAGCDKIIFGTQAAKTHIGKIVSVIGVKNDPKHGPRFEGTVCLGGYQSRVGLDETPNANNCPTDVVIKTTIYSGVFGQTFAAPYRTTEKNPAYANGSVETNIYGGRFTGRFFGTASAPVYGHVTTNITGGYFTGIFGAYNGAVYDGVETNIDNFTEFYNAYLESATNPCKIYAGGVTAQIYNSATLTLDLPADKRLVTPVYAGFSSGGTASKVKVELKNGILPTIYTSADNETFAGSVELVVSGGTVEELVAVRSGATITGGVTCTISGGTVNSYVGTASGTADAAVTCTTDLTTVVSAGKVKSYAGTGDYVNFTGNICNTVSGGTVKGALFAGLGSNVTLNGNLTNTVSSGELYAYPTGKAQGIFLSGRDNCTITKNVTNNISGGMVSVVFDVNKAEGYIYFGGGENTVIEGNLTNNVSGGTIGTQINAGTPTGNAIYAGNYKGGIRGTLTNNISGGSFVFQNAGATNIYLSGRESPYIGKIVNVLGDPETGEGPAIDTNAGNLYLAGYYGAVGFDSKPTSDPSGIREDIVISNTIYGGDYSGTGTVHCGSQGKAATPAKVNGSIETNIYGGSFVNLRGASIATVFGKVCTNIHGGSFSTAIYGTYGGTVYDRVELNILGLKEDCEAKIYGAASSTAIGSALTTGPAVTLTISHPGNFSGSIYAKGSASIDEAVSVPVSVAVSAGTYTNGFKIDGVTVKEALAETYSLLETETGALITLDEGATTSGKKSVTVGRPIAKELKPQTASVVLNTDLGLNFKLPSTFANGFDAGSVYAVFKMGDTETVVNSYTTTGQTATFKFRNIAPHRMGDTVTATIYAIKNGVLYASEPIPYSVKQYCDNQLAKYSDDSYAELRTLLVDLLNYGAVSQQYVDNSLAKDQLVNSHLTPEQQAWGTTGTPALENKTAQTTLDGATVTWKAAGLYLEKSVDIRLKFYAESIEDLSVQFAIGDTTYIVTDDNFTPVSGQDNCYYVYFTRLNPGQMRQEVKATVYQNGVAVSNTLTYSVESYAAKHQNDATPLYLADLVKAMMRYGDSTASYVNNTAE